MFKESKMITLEEENFHWKVNFAHFANGESAKFKFRLSLYFLEYLNDSLYG